MDNTVRVIIADDHPVFRAGLKQILESDKAISIAGEAESGEDAFELISSLSPDIAILDIRMPKKSGLKVLSELQSASSQTKVILLTSYKNENYLFDSISRGAKGYVLKNDALINITDAVKEVANGGQFLSSSLSELFFKKDELPESKVNISEFLSDLTKTERDVLKLIAEWKTNNEIAEAMNISPRTAGNHRTNISTKLNISGSNGLVKFSIENRDLL